MAPSDIIPGFVYMETPGQPEKMLHPEDTKTGIQYRLLPMTRSMISELLTARTSRSTLSANSRQVVLPGWRKIDEPSCQL